MAMIWTTKNEISGLIFDIQRFSIHDGPGIRTTVFLKGCPLNCAWCHNPESIDREKEISFLPGKCIGCGYCFRTCQENAHRMEDDRHVLDRQRCTRCGTCAAECWSETLKVVGREIAVGEVMQEVIQDEAFYSRSGGGLTISGGEPMSQIDFTEALLLEAKARELHTCLETCGFAPRRDFERIKPMVDLFLYDIKETDDSRHRDFTGMPLDPILQNLHALDEAGAAVLLRLPVVPGFNDRDEHFQGVADLAKSLENVRGVEVLPFHLLGRSKDEPLGYAPRTGLPKESAPRETSARWIDLLHELGVPVVES